MLVLSRKIGQSIYIGENIRIVVVEIDHGRVRIGIDAPRNVPIQREEIAGTKTSNPPKSGVQSLDS